MPPIDVPAAGSIRLAPTDGGLLLVLAGEVDAAVVVAFEAAVPRSAGAGRPRNLSDPGAPHA